MIVHSDLDFITDCLKVFILGIVQGLTEFIPVSSTAHLRIFPWVLGWTDPGISISAAIQLGSLIAIFAYFRSELKVIWSGLRKVFNSSYSSDDIEVKLAISILIGSLPIILFGAIVKFFWHDYYSSIFRSINSIGIISIFMGILLYMAEKFGSKHVKLVNSRFIQLFLIGLAQTFAIIPGVSRSGITITAGMFLGLKRTSAARFSFLLGIPAILISGLTESVSIFFDGSDSSIVFVLIGIFSAAFSSYFSIAFLLRYLQSNNTNVFIIYRIMFGLIILSLSFNT